jgi:solute carrier family 25 protein 44
MLDKSKFFFLGAALFSGVSATLYPIVVLKTRQQVSQTQVSCWSVGTNILRQEGFCGLYRGFGASLMGTIPARALYMSALEITKSGVGTTAIQLGFSDPAAAAVTNAAAGLSAAVAAQLVWTPVDVISQKLMVQGTQGLSQISTNYSGGIDAFRSIVKTEGMRGLYRGFGMSIVTYAPSNALWWTSYCIIQRMVWGSLGYCRKKEEGDKEFIAPGTKIMVTVQGFSAAMAGGVVALVTNPLDTIKTRLQVLEGEENIKPTIAQTVRNLVKEGGWGACYRGLGPRWAAMSMSATTMITTYEFIKRMSTKPQENLGQNYK